MALKMVEFVIKDDEMTALDWAALRVLGPRGYDLGTSLAVADATTLRMTVEAGPHLDARRSAIEQYKRIRELAKLPPDPQPQISMVANVRGVPRDADEHIFEAQRLREEQRFELAVVEAQTHFEMHLRDSLQSVAEFHGNVVLALARAQRVWSLRDESGRHLFNVLLDTRPAEFEGWDQYQLHVTRRNDAAHKGIRAEQAEADASVEVVVQFVRFVEKAVEAAIERIIASKTGAAP